MKPKTKRFFLIHLFALFALFSCNEELIEETQNNQIQVVTPNSTLANLMAFTSSNDGSLDDILDNANCFSVNLPVTITAGNITLTISTLEDLEELEIILDELDDEVIEFLFPITITFNNFDEVVIEDEQELEQFIENCVDDDNEVIECVDFQYPISFSIYNTDFQVIDTITVQDDQELFEFLESLVDAENGVVLASLNFPVTLIYANGETIEANSNQELETAINAAEENCSDDDNDCDEELIELNLKNCVWYASLNNNEFSDLEFDFLIENDLLITDEQGSTLFSTWLINQTVDGLFLDLSGLDSFGLEALSGSWLIVECDDDRIELIKGDDVLILEQYCEEDSNPFECFGDYTLTVCDQDDGVEDGLGLFDLDFIFSNCTNNDVDYSFYISLSDAENQVNPLANPLSNVTNPQTIYSRVFLAGNPDEFEIFEHNLIVEDCDDNSNTFECFGDYSLTVCDQDDGVEDGLGLFDLDLIFSNCANNDIDYSFYISISDAENQLNPLASQFVNVSDPQTIYSRVYLVSNPNEFEIFEHNLFIEDCSAENCSQADVNSYLVECIWNITSFNGSDDLEVYNMDFEADSGIVVIYTDDSTIDASWSTSETDDGVWLEFTGVNAANIQAITGDWLIVECSESVLELNKDNDVIILTRNCE